MEIEFLRSESNPDSTMHLRVKDHLIGVIHMNLNPSQVNIDIHAVTDDELSNAILALQAEQVHRTELRTTEAKQLTDRLEEINKANAASGLPPVSMS